MGKLDDIQSLIYELSKEERARLREWFDEYDGDSWDLQFGSDARSGKLNNAAEKAKKSVDDEKARDV